MPPSAGPDTIRILVATDSHVGYYERDPIRKDDSWQSFDEVMRLAKAHDVDMVLLAGDLFHENQPSRKSMYQVMRSLRQNCLGEKPCELEMMSDPGDVLNGDNANYEDPDINVSIPVFSIHGNHDDPTGEGQFCALDVLQMAGLLNYIGRTPESDKIDVKPVLLRKGATKLALYGMSNVRDERLYRTFAQHKVTFFEPQQYRKDWYNILAVHQNHHAHTETSYLPESFLPAFTDLVVWGHEHECLIDPRLNPETNFHVMQPGSSIATSLVAGEAVPKHVAILSITGKEMMIEKIRIKSVRPLVTRDIVLSEDPRLKKFAKLNDNKSRITQELEKIVHELIKEATDEWQSIQDPDDPPDEVPLPLIRLRVETSAPDGGRFDTENPQRFSNRFVGKVANDGSNGVVQFYTKKKVNRRDKVDLDMPDPSILAAIAAADNVTVGKLVRENLGNQSLKILPQTAFGNAVVEFVDKDDKDAMQDFVKSSLSKQVNEILKLNTEEGDSDEDLDPLMELVRQQHEEAALKDPTFFKQKVLKPEPDDWNPALDGEWKDNPDAWNVVESTGRAASHDDDVSVMSDNQPKKSAIAKKAPAKKAPVKVKALAKAKAPAKKAPTRGRKKAVEPSDDDDDVIMLDDSPPKRVAARAMRAAPTAKGRQTQLSFSQSQAPKAPVGREPSDDEISDDDGAFEPVASSSRRR